MLALYILTKNRHFSIRHACFLWRNVFASLCTASRMKNYWNKKPLKIRLTPRISLLYRVENLWYKTDRPNHSVVYYYDTQKYVRYVYRTQNAYTFDRNVVRGMCVHFFCLRFRQTLPITITQCRLYSGNNKRMNTTHGLNHYCTIVLSVKILNWCTVDWLNKPRKTHV